MRVVVVLEHRFARTPDGAVWTQTFFAHSFWRRYLAVFDAVKILARVEEVQSVPSTSTRVDGGGVSVAAVPHYIGPLQYARKYFAVRRAVRDALGDDDAVILRVSSQIATGAEGFLRRGGHPFAVEVVADPADVFAPGSVDHPLRRFFRWWFPYNLRRQCASAAAAGYVTQTALQRRYPAATGAFTTHYSSVELGPDAFVSQSRSSAVIDRPFRLLMAGTLEEFYKGPDILLMATAACVARGMDLELTFLGDGRRKNELVRQAETLGILNRVRFAGSVAAGAAVREHMDYADLFVLPSRQEGLPRAMIEAMARALPCIGSCAGGMRELLAPEDIVPIGDAAGLADKLSEAISDSSRLARMSARNLAKATEYRDDVLAERRNALYRHLRACTQKWLDTQPARGAIQMPHMRESEVPE